MRPAALALATLFVVAGSVAEAGAEDYRYDRYRGLECIGESPVIGRSHCAEFGRWALPEGLPRVQVALGVEFRNLGDHRFDFGEGASDGRAAARVVDGRDPGGAVVEGPSPMGGDVLAFDLRMTGDLARVLYTGVDVSVGRARISHPDFERAAGVTIDDGGGMYYAAGAVAGLVLHGGPLVLRGEILGGARLAEVMLRVEEPGYVRRSRTSAVQPVLEPRAALELWLGPWVTIGAHVGSDLLREGDLLVGLRLSVYGRAYNDSRYAIR